MRFKHTKTKSNAARIKTAADRRVATAGNIATAALFALFLAFFFLMGIFGEKEAVSPSERRQLEELPAVSAERLVSGRFFRDIDAYTRDHFPFRESLRRVKAMERFYLFARLENNGIGLFDGMAVKVETALHEEYITDNVTLWRTLKETCFPDNRAAFAVIPDKNYFLADRTPHWDYDAFFSLVRENAPQDAEEIDLTGLLSLSDYYATDIHWRQEKIVPVAGTIADALGVRWDPAESYTRQNAGNFYGVYYGQSALPLAPEPLHYLENDTLAQAKAFLWQAGEEGFLTEEVPIYTPANGKLADPYNLFLSGPQPAVELVNPGAGNGKTLILFRDSFASSLAPLLLSGYERILLWDTRYLPVSYLSFLPEIYAQADLLFLYTTTTLNSLPMR